MRNPPSDPYLSRVIERAFRISVTVPGSKSLTNRALLLAALASNSAATIINPLRADDSEVMVGALRQLSGDNCVHIEKNAQGYWQKIIINQHCGVSGSSPSANDLRIDLHNAGTAVRFLTAACCAVDFRRTVVIDGNERMRERPIGELVELLRSIGAKIEYTENTGFPPVRIVNNSEPLSGGVVRIGNILSSQYISALLMIAPICREGVIIELAGSVPSVSYIKMTLALMERFGAVVRVEGDLKRIIVEGRGYRGQCGGCRGEEGIEYAVEPDASSATYFLAAGVIGPCASSCTVEGLGKDSLQGDIGFADILQRMGAGLLFGDDFITVISHESTDDNDVSTKESMLTGIDIDMIYMPDAALTLAVVALFARGETVIRGVGNLRYKETDRLMALQNELRKFGAEVDIEDDDILIINPPDYSKLINNKEPIDIETYDDHRMAMAFAVAGLRVPGVRIHGPGCVNKTYPDFWNDWELLYEG